MKFPWYPGIPPADDVDSLQADVMRFIAIFGLCLAAIFSLVKELEYEYPQVQAHERVAVEVDVENKEEWYSPATDRDENPVEEAREDVSAQSPTSPTTKALPDQAESQKVGFTLQFESSAAMQALMLQRAIRVYAKSGDTFWLLDGFGGIERAAAPASFYGMHPATLPPGILAAAAKMGELSGAEWAVTLPDSTAKRIMHLMQSGDHGALIIHADATVRRDESAP